MNEITVTDPLKTAIATVVDAKAAVLKALVEECDARMGAKIAAANRSFEERVIGAVETLVSSIAPRVEKIIVAGPHDKGKPVKGKTHACFARVVKLASIRRNILLVGPAGCGKTYLAKQAAEALGLRFGAISLTAGTSESHVQGYLLPIKAGGSFVYVSSVFVDIYENGGVMLLDEIDGADENMLLALNAALANGEFFVPQRHDKPLVKRHKDFVCIAAANTFGHGADMMYAGRNKLDGATLDRFRAGIVKIDYDPVLETETVDPEVLVWGRRIREQINAKGLRRIMSTRVMQDFSANKTLLGDKQADWEASYFADWTRDERLKLQA